MARERLPIAPGAAGRSADRLRSRMIPVAEIRELTSGAMGSVHGPWPATASRDLARLHGRVCVTDIRRPSSHLLGADITPGPAT